MKWLKRLTLFDVITASLALGTLIFTVARYYG